MGQTEARTFVTKASKLLEIRCATPEDVPELIQYRADLLSEETWVPALPSDSKLTEGDERAWIEHHLASPSRLIILARVEGRLVGVLHCDNSAFQRTAHRAELALSVAKAYREQGIGDALLRVFVEWAEDNPHLEKVSLNVLGDNVRALQLFSKMKFTREGIKRREVKLASGMYLDMVYLERFVDGTHPRPHSH